MIFRRSFDSFRDKSLVNINKADFQELIFEYNSYDRRQFTNNGGQWYMDNEEKLDSLKMDAYLSTLSNLNGMEFDDSFDANTAALFQTLTIKANNRVDEVEINCYFHQEGPDPFIINSSLNPDAYFKSDTAGIYKTIFTIPL